MAKNIKKRKPVYFFIPGDKRSKKRAFDNKREAYTHLSRYGGTLYGPYYRTKKRTVKFGPYYRDR